jgi:hypothetical protein
MSRAEVKLTGVSNHDGSRALRVRYGAQLLALRAGARWNPPLGHSTHPVTNNAYVDRLGGSECHELRLTLHGCLLDRSFS